MRRSFEGFVPKRLHGQINQWLSVYCGDLVGQVVEELIRRGRLEKPEIVGTAAVCREPGEEKPLANGVFYVEGDYMRV